MASHPPLALDSWLISDTHFGHDNIRRLCGRPDDHEWRIHDAWKEMVRARDVIVHLGDLAYRGSDSYLKQFFVGLPGDKYLLPGNHDKKPNSWYERRGFTVLDCLLREIVLDRRTIRHTGFYWHDGQGRRILFSHYPDQQLLDWTINIHGHIHNNDYPAGCNPERDYRNISVEVTGYRPLRLRDVLCGEDGIHYASPRLSGNS